MKPLRTWHLLFVFLIALGTLVSIPFAQTFAETDSTRSAAASPAPDRQAAPTAGDEDLPRASFTTQAEVDRFFEAFKTNPGDATESLPSGSCKSGYTKNGTPATICKFMWCGNGSCRKCNIIEGGTPLCSD